MPTTGEWREDRRDRIAYPAGAVRANGETMFGPLVVG
jgi:hypothetical protein